MKLTFTSTNGLTFGIEHLACPEGMDTDGIEYMIVIHLLMFKICLLKFE